MAKVKDYWEKWDRIVFNDRSILRPDLRLMSGAQVGELSRLDVGHVETESDGYTTLVVSQG